MRNIITLVLLCSCNSSQLRFQHEIRAYSNYYKSDTTTPGNYTIIDRIYLNNDKTRFVEYSSQYMNDFYSPELAFFNFDNDILNKGYFVDSGIVYLPYLDKRKGICLKDSSDPNELYSKIKNPNFSLIDRNEERIPMNKTVNSIIYSFNNGGIDLASYKAIYDSNFNLLEKYEIKGFTPLYKVVSYNDIINDISLNMLDSLELANEKSMKETIDRRSK